MDDQEMVVIFDAEDEIQALLNRTLLEEAGIPVFERLMEAETLEGVKQQGLHSKLLVRLEDVKKALPLIWAFHEESDSGELADDLDNDVDEDSRPRFEL